MLNALGMGVSLLGGMLGNRSASRARRAQEEGIRQADGYLGQAQDGFRPYQQAGEQGLNRLSALMGGDYSGFEDSPDYTYARDQGVRAIDRSAAARGSLYSGGADADRMTFASGLASQNLGNYRNSLFGLAGMGQQAAGSMADLYTQRGNLAMGRGDARANEASQRGANWQNALGNIWSFGSDMLGSRSMKPGKG